MWPITDRIYLGTIADAQAIGDPGTPTITHVLNCAEEVACYFPGRVQYLHLMLKDPDEGMLARLPEAFAFLDGARDGTTLVHCRGGISRSPSVIMAYLCKNGMTLAQASAVLAKQTPTRPNVTFLRQVAAFTNQRHTLAELSRLLDVLSCGEQF